MFQNLVEIIVEVKYRSQLLVLPSTFLQRSKSRFFYKDVLRIETVDLTYSMLPKDLVIRTPTTPIYFFYDTELWYSFFKRLAKCNKVKIQLKHVKHFNFAKVLKHFLTRICKNEKFPIFIVNELFLASFPRKTFV